MVKLLYSMIIASALVPFSFNLQKAVTRLWFQKYGAGICTITCDVLQTKTRQLGVLLSYKYHLFSPKSSVSFLCRTVQNENTGKGNNHSGQLLFTVSEISKSLYLAIVSHNQFSVVKATLQSQMSVRSFVRPYVCPSAKPLNSFKSSSSIIHPSSFIFLHSSFIILHHSSFILPSFRDF